jgi:hypothetical protein
MWGSVEKRLRDRCHGIDHRLRNRRLHDIVKVPCIQRPVPRRRGFGRPSTAAPFEVAGLFMNQV